MKNITFFRLSTVYIAYFLLVFQWPLLSKSVTLLDMGSWVGWQSILTIEIAQIGLLAITIGLSSLLSFWAFRIIASLLLIGCATALYYMNAYGIVITIENIGNVINTNTGEAGEQVNIEILLFVFFAGVLPSIYLFWVKIVPLAYWKRLLIAPVAALSLAGYLTLVPASVAWLGANDESLGSRLLPWSIIANTARYYEESRGRNLGTQIELADAKRTSNAAKLVVLVIGESARAQNFSWYGYQRDTNPYTRAAGFTALDASHACKTFTLGAVGCMLSPNGTAEQRKGNLEALPSFVQRMGIKTYVRTNNSGLPRLKVEKFSTATELSADCKTGFCLEKLAPICSFGTCREEYLDSALFVDLDQVLAQGLNEPVFLVLHLNGSHFPNFFERYPSKYERFTPVCTDRNVKNCDYDSLQNAYDNSLLFTDALLAELAHEISAIQGLDATILYASDHGESLGENGVYFHGAPYDSAPIEQLLIPFLAWSNSQLPPVRKDIPAQDAIFHSVLGALDLIQGGPYQRNKDIFAPE